MENLSNDHKDLPNQHKNSHSYVRKWDILFWIWWKVNGNWDNNMIRILQWRERHCRTNTSIRRKIKFVRAWLWESQSGIWVGKLTIWIRSFGKPVLMIDAKVSKDKSMSRLVDWENLICVRWNRIKNHAQRWRGWSTEEKEVRHWLK